MLSRSEKAGHHFCRRLICHFPALSLAPGPGVFPPILSVRCFPAILVPYPSPTPSTRVSTSAPIETLKGSVLLAKPKSGAPVQCYNHEKNLVFA